MTPGGRSRLSSFFFLPFFTLCYISLGGFFVFLHLGLPRWGGFLAFLLSSTCVWAHCVYIFEVYYPGFDIKEMVGFGHSKSYRLLLCKT